MVIGEEFLYDLITVMRFAVLAWDKYSKPLSVGYIFLFVKFTLSPPKLHLMHKKQPPPPKS